VLKRLHRFETTRVIIKHERYKVIKNDRKRANKDAGNLLIVIND